MRRQAGSETLTASERSYALTHVQPPRRVRPPGLRDRPGDTVTEKLGPAPRQGLSALVGYGLSDDEIAQYHGMAPQLVTNLRILWGIAGDH